MQWLRTFNEPSDKHCDSSEPCEDSVDSSEPNLCPQSFTVESDGHRSARYRERTALASTISPHKCDMKNRQDGGRKHIKAASERTSGWANYRGPHMNISSLSAFNAAWCTYRVSSLQGRQLPSNHWHSQLNTHNAENNQRLVSHKKTNICTEVTIKWKPSRNACFWNCFSLIVSPPARVTVVISL